MSKAIQYVTKFGCYHRFPLVHRSSQVWEKWCKIRRKQETSSEKRDKETHKMPSTSGLVFGTSTAVGPHVQSCQYRGTGEMAVRDSVCKTEPGHEISLPRYTSLNHFVSHYLPNRTFLWSHKGFIIIIKRSLSKPTWFLKARGVGWSLPKAGQWGWPSSFTDYYVMPITTSCQDLNWNQTSV